MNEPKLTFTETDKEVMRLLMIKSPMYVSNIAREGKLLVSSVLRSVAKLGKLKFVESQKTGKMRFYWLTEKGIRFYKLMFSV